MAYLDTSDVFSQFGASSVQAPAELLLVPDFQRGPDFQLGPDLPLAPEPPAGFDHTEWAVIAMARTDDLATLREPQRSRLGRLFFGAPRTYRLTADRLEALRRLAVEAWRQPRTISLPTLGAFISVGFSSAQLALLLSTTGALPVMAQLISTSLKLALPNSSAPANAATGTSA